MKQKCFLFILFLFTGCATTDLYNSCGREKGINYILAPRTSGSIHIRDWTSAELSAREKYFVNNGRINTDPTISCFASGYSYNLVGCWDSDLIKRKYNNDPVFDLSRWESALAITQNKFKGVVSFANSSVDLWEVAPRRYYEVKSLKKKLEGRRADREGMVDHVESLKNRYKEDNIPLNHRVATCEREFDGKIQEVTSVIFISK